MPDALISFSWATLARKYPLSGVRSVPTMETATWCRTPAAASAARRLRPEVSKNSSTALSSNDGELARSITTCVPAMASSRPSPVMVLTPVLGEAATTSWPPRRSMGTVFEPMRPVPPITTIFIPNLRKTDQGTAPPIERIPSRFARLPRSGRERARHALDAVDEVRAQQVGGAGDLEVGQAGEDLAEHHAHLAAREVGAEAVVRARAAEADVFVRGARHVEIAGVQEHALVAIAGVVPEHHLVAGPDLLAAELGVARGGAPEVDHRRGPPHDLLDRGGRDPLEVRHPLAALAGEVRQRLHAMADRVPRGLVARHHEQHEERRQLLLRERLALELGVHQRRGEIFLRVLAALLGELVHQVRERLPRRERRDQHVPSGLDVLGVAEPEDPVGLLEDELRLALGDAHHVADDLERERRRDLGHEVAATLLDHAVDRLLRPTLHVGFGPGERAGREAARHDAAQPPVLRVVHVDHRAEELVERLGQITDLAALARAEDLGGAARLEDVGVTRDRPVARSARERDLRRRLELLVEGDGLLATERGEGGGAHLGRLHPEIEAREIDVVGVNANRGAHDFFSSATSAARRVSR